MAIHNHIPSMIVDDDIIPLFSIDSVTREIICNSEDEIIIMQNDANSERLTFEIDEYIEGHNMMDCNVVQIHYINTGANGTGTTVNIYNVTDLSIVPTKPGTLKFSWLVSRNATKFIGNLRFAVRFFCTNSAEPQEEGDPVTGQILYEWSTGVSSVIRIGESIRNNTEIEDTIEIDLLSGLKQELMGDFQWVTDPSNPEATEPTFLQFTDKDDNVITSVNLKSSVKGDQGDKGDTPIVSVGTVKTTDIDDPEPSVEVEHIDDDNNPTLKFVLPQPNRDYVTFKNKDGIGSDVWFFSGTQAEYDALTEEQKNNAFAVIDDDDVLDTLKQEIGAEVEEELISNEEFKNDIADSLINIRSNTYMYQQYTQSKISVNTTRTIYPTTTGDNPSPWQSTDDVVCADTELVLCNGIGILGVTSMNKKLIDTYQWGTSEAEIVKLYAYNIPDLYGSCQYIITYEVYLAPNKTYSEFTINIQKEYDGYIVDYKDQKRILVNSSKKDVFEIKVEDSFYHVHRNINDLPSPRDYIIDADNNLFKVIETSTGGILKVLLIRPTIKKLYTHYVFVEALRNYNASLDTTNARYTAMQACFSYTSSNPNVGNSLEEVIDDMISENYNVNQSASVTSDFKYPCSGWIEHKYADEQFSERPIAYVQCFASENTSANTDYLLFSTYSNHSSDIARNFVTYDMTEHPLHYVKVNVTTTKL